MADSGNSNKLLIWGAVGVGLIFLFKKVIQPNVLEPIRMAKDVIRMRIGKIYAVKFGAKNDQVEFKFPIENPNSTVLTVRAIVGDVFISDRAGKKKLKIGTISHYGNDVIRPTGTTDFDLVVKVNLVNEFLLFSQMIGGQWVGQTLQFVGNVNANNRPWPVNQSIRIS